MGRELDSAPAMAVEGLAYDPATDAFYSVVVDHDNGSLTSHFQQLREARTLLRATPTATGEVCTCHGHCGLPTWAALATDGQHLLRSPFQELPVTPTLDQGSVAESMPGGQRHAPAGRGTDAYKYYLDPLLIRLEEQLRHQHLEWV